MTEFEHDLYSCSYSDKVPYYSTDELTSYAGKTALYYYSTDELTIPMRSMLKHQISTDHKLYIDRTSTIKKVIQNGPATIIVDCLGRKTVVKARGEKVDKVKGFYMCLLKFSTSPKEYSDVLSLYPNNPSSEKHAVKGALSLIYGKKKLAKLVDKWVK